jgi:hypothetical protein
MEVYIDQKGHQWYIGTTEGTLTPTPNARWVILPILVEPMYPEESNDLTFSHCALCGQSISDRGCIVLEFVEAAWGVRIGCPGCTGPSGPSGPLIVFVSGLITPIIEAGCKTVYHGCIVCEKPGKCTNEKCRQIIDSGILTTSPVDDLLEHFYRIRLDVVSPLMSNNGCAHCKSPCDRLCRVCRIAYYCNYGCKMKSGHKCVPFIEMWRVGQRDISPLPAPNEVGSN